MESPCVFHGCNESTKQKTTASRTFGCPPAPTQKQGVHQDHPTQGRHQGLSIHHVNFVPNTENRKRLPDDLSDRVITRPCPRTTSQDRRPAVPATPGQQDPVVVQLHRGLMTTSNTFTTHATQNNPWNNLQRRNVVRIVNESLMLMGCFSFPE